ncbi:unnamed protein product [Leptosia nina]|uniref:Methyltransferase small domain-containing protein n=1 Tax=Leptosia nina TaxID=320188 RepID=A0AAV1J7V1_9NEOP
MAFPQPNAQRELTNRKILEELQLKKQMLLKQGAVAPLTATTISLTQPSPVSQLPMCSIPPLSATAGFPQLPEANIVNTSHRAALQHANATSCGYFVSQDSSFGNQILPGHLGSLSGFSKPKIEYEQYETPSHIAAVALYTVQTQYEALENKLVLDAGCGPGMLSFGASLLGAGAILAVDIDEEALNVLGENIEDTGVDNIDVVQCDFLSHDMFRCENYFDTVIMNPPFGTKNNAGVDMKFLKMGLALSSDSVYSLHKSTTRSHIQKKVKEWGVEGSVIAELRYNLPSTYKFHKQQTKDIAVDLWRLHHSHL